MAEREQPSLSKLEELIAFFEAHPYEVMSARQIALRVGWDAGEVQKDLDLLMERRVIQKVRYPGGTEVYRYIPAAKKIV